MNERQFVRLAGLAALCSVLTTIGVHFIEFQADTFEARLALARNPTYIYHKWMIIFHCLLVIIADFGFAVVKFENNRGLIGLGVLFFAVFGIAEMTRMFMALAYLNGLREKYLAATDEATRQFLQLSLDQWGLVSTVPFLLFIFTFALGNICFGLPLLRDRGADRWMGRALVFWGLFSFVGFGNHFWQYPTLNVVVDYGGKFALPVLRAAIGWWLIRKSRDLLSGGGR